MITDQIRLHSVPLPFHLCLDKCVNNLFLYQQFIVCVRKKGRTTYQVSVYRLGSGSFECVIFKFQFNSTHEFDSTVYVYINTK